MEANFEPIPWDAFRLHGLQDWTWTQRYFSDASWRQDARFFYRTLRQQSGLSREDARHAFLRAFVYLTRA